MLVAGTASAGMWHVGARGGVNVSSLHGEFTDIVDPGWLVTPTVGGFAEAEVASLLSVGIELNYIQMGATFIATEADDTGNPVGTFESHLVLEYAQIPILARVLMPVTGPVRSYILAGPAFGFALKGTARADRRPTLDVGDDMKPLDLGAIAGAGLRIAWTHGSSVDLEARYATGFSDVWDLSDNLESINHGISFTLAMSR
jgi:hypothetical protein